MRLHLADASAGVSIFSAAVANLTLNHLAAAVAVLSGLYAIYDRWDRRRRDAKAPSE